MILTIDIGNTNITAGLYKGEALALRASLPTLEMKRFGVFLARSLKQRNIDPRRIHSAVICSVAPKALAPVKKAAAGLGDFPVYIAGQDLVVPLKNLYSRPKQVGQDRLVCAWSAIRRYGAPVIVIDLGTALTFDAVSQKEEYLGGLILPGARLSLLALHKGTALLPRIRLERPASIIGKDTKGSMLSGLVYGFSAMIDGLAKKLRREIGEKAKIALTGGDAGLFRRYCSKSYYFEPDLILKGLKDLAGAKKK